MDIAIITEQGSRYLRQMVVEISGAKKAAWVKMGGGAAAAAAVQGFAYFSGGFIQPYYVGLAVGLGVAVAAVGFAQMQAAGAMDKIRQALQGMLQAISVA
jgi:hypothetical protein